MNNNLFVFKRIVIINNGVIQFRKKYINKYRKSKMLKLDGI